MWIRQRTQCLPKSELKQRAPPKFECSSGGGDRQQHSTLRYGRDRARFRYSFVGCLHFASIIQTFRWKLKLQNSSLSSSGNSKNFSTRPVCKGEFSTRDSKPTLLTSLGRWDLGVVSELCFTPTSREAQGRAVSDALARRTT